MGSVRMSTALGSLGAIQGPLGRLQAGKKAEKQSRMQGEQGLWRPPAWVRILPAYFLIETSGTTPGLCQPVSAVGNRFVVDNLKEISEV